MRCSKLVAMALFSLTLAGCGGGGGGGDDDNEGGSDNPFSPSPVTSPSENSDNSDDNTAPALTPPSGQGTVSVPNAPFLVALWSRCDTNEQSGGVFNSIQADLEITNETSLRLEQHAFTDAACRQPFAEQNANEFLAQIEGQVTREEYEQYAQQLYTLIQGIETRMGYKAGAPNAQGIGLMDIIDENGEASYTSYRLAGNQLSIADTCTQSMIEMEECTRLIGENPSNRATSFSGVRPFIKQN